MYPGVHFITHYTLGNYERLLHQQCWINIAKTSRVLERRWLARLRTLQTMCSYQQLNDYWKTSKQHVQQNSFQQGLGASLAGQTQDLQQVSLSIAHTCFLQTNMSYVWFWRSFIAFTSLGWTSVCFNLTPAFRNVVVLASQQCWFSESWLH